MKTQWESCYACRGSGCELGMEGDIATCYVCSGHCVIRMRDKKGRFTSKELDYSR